jgi:alkanesulfonate monooxygenase SsuD/methylene tetrahydromethanopterin reductase-like flavin-dependent oxidoreductase (luciferase family)
MKVFVFDLLAFDRIFDEYKPDRFMPYPLPRAHFDPETAARSYAEHLEVWKEMDRLGYDGVGLNEHHTTPHGLMNSPNMMAAVGAQHTKNLKFLLLGNLLPLHNPLRIAEELAMADCLSRGRVLAGFARGVPREYKVYDVPMSESRARFEEAYEVILKAWTTETFSHQGKYWKFNNIAIWPRPYQQPHPPVWVPFTGSKETIEWAGKHGLNAVFPDVRRGLTEDIVRHFAQSLAKHGHRIHSDRLCLFTDAWVAESKAKALEEYAPYFLYFTQVLWHHGSLDKDGKGGGGPPPSSTSHDYVRPENRPFAELDRAKIRQMNLADVEKRVLSNQLAWGSAKEVTELLIDAAEHAGANSLLLNINLGAMPNALFLEQIRRFGRDVLPKLQAHQVARVPAAELVG